LKVLIPAVFSWIIEPDKGVFVFMPGSNTAPFTEVTEAAGKREVYKSSGASLFFTDDVINVIGSEGDSLGHTAVFAAIIGCFGDLPAKNNGDVSFTHAFMRRL
jgi:hypothetical protein